MTNGILRKQTYILHFNICVKHHTKGGMSKKIKKKHRIPNGL